MLVKVIVGSSSRASWVFMVHHHKVLDMPLLDITWFQDVYVSRRELRSALIIGYAIIVHHNLANITNPQI